MIPHCFYCSVTLLDPKLVLLPLQRSSAVNENKNELNHDNHFTDGAIILFLSLDKLQVTMIPHLDFRQG